MNSSKQNKRQGDPHYTVETLIGPETALPLSVVEAQMVFLRENLLTIARASFSDAAQRAAVESLIESAVSTQLRRINDIAYPTWADVQQAA